MDGGRWRTVTVYAIISLDAHQATLRNLAIGILKTAGHTSIAAACRHHARDATRTLETLGLDPA
jgi:hypothetical protein